MQLNGDSQPLIGRESLSNLLLAQVEIAVHVEEDEQAVHVASAKIALQLNDDSQPLVGLRSLSNFPLRHVKEVQVARSEQSVQVAPATDMIAQYFGPPTQVSPV